MSKPMTFQGRKYGSYELKLENDEVQISCYLKGSVTGGSGTECTHTITGENVVKFLADIGLRSFTDLRKEVKSYTESKWQKLHVKIIEYQTSSWSWSDTDWND